MLRKQWLSHDHFWDKTKTLSDFPCLIIPTIRLTLGQWKHKICSCCWKMENINSHWSSRASHGTNANIPFSDVPIPWMRQCSGLNLTVCLVLKAVFLQHCGEQDWLWMRKLLGASSENSNWWGRCPSCVWDERNPRSFDPFSLYETNVQYVTKLKEKIKFDCSDRILETENKLVSIWNRWRNSVSKHGLNFGPFDLISKPISIWVCNKFQFLTMVSIKHPNPLSRIFLSS